MRPLRALILEDDELDGELLSRALERAQFQISHERVFSGGDFQKALAGGEWDIILSDFNMPGFTALDALRIVHELKWDLPIIVVSGAIGEERAVELMKAGAEDYILKSNLARLIPAIERSINAADTRAQERAMRAAADIAIRDRENMLAIVSHDLKNPLGAIRLNHQLMVRVLGTGEMTAKETKALSLLGRAQRSAERMEKLIEDVLDVAKIEAGRFVVEMTENRPDELISELLELHQPAAIQKSIVLQAEIPEKSCVGYFDHSRMFQVFSNLIGNAIKFTPEGGTVTVRLTSATDGLVVAVSDVGCGIASEHLPHIFDRFYQVKNTARLGTGLGLSIAKGIVDAHGGRLWVESTVGSGSTFYVKLKAAPLQPEKSVSG